jgi:hypothetical protein
MYTHSFYVVSCIPYVFVVCLSRMEFQLWRKLGLQSVSSYKKLVKLFLDIDGLVYTLKGVWTSSYKFTSCYLFCLGHKYNFDKVEKFLFMWTHDFMCCTTSWSHVFYYVLPTKLWCLLKLLNIIWNKAISICTSRAATIFWLENLRAMQKLEFVLVAFWYIFF